MKHTEKVILNFNKFKDTVGNSFAYAYFAFKKADNKDLIVSPYGEDGYCIFELKEIYDDLYFVKIIMYEFIGTAK